MQIQKYTPKYKKQIPELFTNSIYKTCHKDYTKEQLKAWAGESIDYEFWEKRLDKTKPYLALREDRLLGFVEFSGDYIDCFYVDYKSQGLGVGKALFLYVLELAKKDRVLKLKVDASITAKPFFERLGFYEIRKNKIKRAGEILINYSLEFDIVY